MSLITLYSNLFSKYINVGVSDYAHVYNSRRA